MFKEITLVLLASCAFAFPASSIAQHWGHHEIHRFHERDIGVWRGGRWFHGNYGGRLGWYWVVGGVYYYYSAPIYPYPDPYLPPVITAPPVPTATVWYFCEPTKSYYPYTPTCPVPWQQVPATPGVPPR
jgi:hypothetical protein